MAPTAFQSLPSKVVFGKGALAAAPAISARSQAEASARLAELLGETAVAGFDRAAMHTPVEVTDEAMAVVGQQRIDGLIAVGGGSAIGLSKAIALRTGLPQIAVPTTYA